MSLNWSYCSQTENAIVKYIFADKTTATTITTTTITTSTTAITFSSFLNYILFVLSSVYKTYAIHFARDCKLLTPSSSKITAFYLKMKF